MSRSRRCLALALAASVSLSGTRSDADVSEAPRSEGPEILHMPLLERVAEQGILQAAPITLDLPSEVAGRARRVLVHYRLWGDPDWTTLELRRAGARYAGAIPCLEISTVTGDLRYYIRVHDAEGHVIAAAASRAKPYLVTIKHDDALASDTPYVARCPDPADCPRGLPGCPSELVVEIACKSDADCEGATTCSWRGFCEREVRTRNWISLSIEQDLGVISRSGACSVQAQEHEGYACYRADGKQYVGSPVLTNEPLAVGRGPTRVVLGFDRLIHYNTSLGVRLGFAVLGSGPTPRDGTAFVPVSVAARATHWFGEDPFARPGPRPFAFVTAGYAMVDVETTAHVREDPTATVYQSSNDLEQSVDLWKRAGDGFVGLGGGVAFPLSRRTAAVAEIAVLEVFPFRAFVIAPSAGVMLGF